MGTLVTARTPAILTRNPDFQTQFLESYTVYRKLSGHCQAILFSLTFTFTLKTKDAICVQVIYLHHAEFSLFA